MCAPYNGWAGGYPTWCVALWIDNDEFLTSYRDSLVKESRRQAPRCRQVRDGTWTEEEAARFLLADALKSWVEEWVDDLALPPSALSDILSWAIGCVDWQEIADAWLEE